MFELRARGNAIWSRTLEVKIDRHAARASDAVTLTDFKHRLAAILAADAAGYSRLMSGDDRSTVATLDAARAVFRTRIEANRAASSTWPAIRCSRPSTPPAGAVTAALAVQVELAASVPTCPKSVV